MAHIDRGYTNPYRSLRNKQPLKFRDNLDNWDRGTQLLGAFQPIVDIERDIANTFRAYKSFRHVLWDLAQPFRGFFNGVAGLAQIVYTPFYLLGQLTIGNIIDAVTSPKGDRLSSVWGNTTRTLAKSTSWITNGAMKIIRGVTQVIFTPLSWVKMIARGLSTAENKGVQRLVDDRSIQRLVKQGQALEQAIQQEKAHAQQPTTTQGLAEDPEGLTSKNPLVERSPNEKKLNEINTQLLLKFNKAVTRTKAKKALELPKRLDFVGKDGPRDGNWLKFFKEGSDQRKAELQQISAKRFGRGAAAA